VNNGDESHSALVEAHGALVWRTLCALLGRDDAVDDCFQETFLEFIRHADGAAARTPKALLVSIATRRAIDLIRRRSAQRAAARKWANEGVASAPEPLDSMVGKELSEALGAALVTLPQQQAAVFVMTQLEEMPHGDVAGALGIRENHVGVLLFRARAALQERLKHFLSAERRRV